MSRGRLVAFGLLCVACLVVGAVVLLRDDSPTAGVASTGTMVDADAATARAV